MSEIRCELELQGRLQGVGFRPLAFRLARQLGLSGWVRNTAQGVTLALQGLPGGISEFERRIAEELPAHAAIRRWTRRSLPLCHETDFRIAPSRASGRQAAELLPDLATCAACASEVLDPRDRRYRYPFTNCTHCGPRYSIIEEVPYDRQNTTMRGFPLCPRCLEEYGDPRDRRFQCLGLQLEAELRGADHSHRRAAGQRHHFRIAHPVGRRDDDFIAGVQRRHQRVVEHLLAAGADTDLAALVGQAVLALKLRDDRVLQLGNAVHRGILGLAGFNGVDRRQLDVGGRVEVRLAGAEADDVAARLFELTCFIRDRDGRGRLHTVKRSGQKRHHVLLRMLRVAKARIRGFWRAGHPKAGDAASQETSPKTQEIAQRTKKTLKRAA